MLSEREALESNQPYYVVDPAGGKGSTAVLAAIHMWYQMGERFKPAGRKASYFNPLGKENGGE